MLKKAVMIGTIVLIFLILIGCKTEKAETVTIENPFISGTQGIIADFENLRADVRDQAQDPFDVLVKIENKGETDILAKDLQVKLSGINPAEFGATQGDLIKKPEDDAPSQKKSPEGTITPAPPIFVEFLGLNYQPKVTGAQITFPLKADICYKYTTKGVGKLCIRSDILTQKEGICDIIGDKTIYTSSAPVQIANLKESARAKKKIGFTFEILNAGDGEIYKKETACEKIQRQNENKVYVTVETNLLGLKCVGLENPTPQTAAGEVTLYSNSRLVSCSQETPTNDFEQVITITAEYDYETSKTTQIIVKSSGAE